METNAFRTRSELVRLAKNTSASSSSSMASHAFASPKIARRRESVVVTSVPSSPLVTQYRGF